MWYCECECLGLLCRVREGVMNEYQVASLAVDSAFIQKLMLSIWGFFLSFI